MTREILFKAKRKNWRELPKENWWVEGNYVKIAFIHDEGYEHYIIEIEKNGGTFEIDPNTVRQCTGLTDKNGRKIWENDICEMVYNGVIYVYVVVWDKEELDFKGTNGKENYGGNFEYLGCCEEIVVIGNIFDDADLLEVER